MLPARVLRTMKAQRRRLWVGLEMRLEGPLRHANEGDRRFRSRFGNVRSFWGGQGLVETGLWEKIGHKLKVESQVLH